MHLLVSPIIYEQSELGTTKVLIVSTMGQIDKVLKVLHFQGQKVGVQSHLGQITEFLSCSFATQTDDS